MSKSQQRRILISLIWCCHFYHKGNEFWANHNLNYRIERARLYNTPKDIKKVLMRNHWVQQYVSDIEHGHKPSYQGKWHFNQIMLEHGLQPSYDAGTLVHAILRWFLRYIFMMEFLNKIFTFIVCFIVLVAIGAFIKFVLFAP